MAQFISGQQFSNGGNDLLVLSVSTGEFTSASSPPPPAASKNPDTNGYNGRMYLQAEFSKNAQGEYGCLCSNYYRATSTVSASAATTAAEYANLVATPLKTCLMAPAVATLGSSFCALTTGSNSDPRSMQCGCTKCPVACGVEKCSTCKFGSSSVCAVLFE